MANQLKNILTFTNIAPGASSSQNHNLNINGLALLPDEVKRDNSTFSVSATSTAVTVTNSGNATATVNVMVESFHTIERAFGASTVLNLSPQPFYDGGAANSGVPSGMDAALFSDTPGTYNVYVDAINGGGPGIPGSDSNDGLTPTTALATIGEVKRKFGMWRFSGSQLIVNLADDGAGGVQTYAERSIWLGGGEAFAYSYVFRGPEMVDFAPNTGPATAALDNVPCVVVGRRTRFDFTAVNPLWTGDDFLANAFIRITRPNSGQVLFELPITGNTASSIFVDVLGITAGVTVLNTDTVTIVTPGALITSNVAFTPITVLGFACANAFGTSGYSFERIAFLESVDANVTGLAFDRCQLAGGYFNNGTVGFVNSQSTSGITIGSASTSMFTGSHGTVLTATVQFGLLVISAPLWIGSEAQFAVPVGNGVYYADWNHSVYNSAFTAGIVVTGPGSWWYSGNLVNPTVDIQGTGNSTVGILAAAGALVRINGGVHDTIIAGAGANLAVDTGIVIAFGTGAGQFEEAVGFNGNFYRMNGSVAATPTGNQSRITTLA